MARRYGAGTVWQLPNGRWSGQWSAGRDEYGNRVRGTVTADSEAAAWKALTAARGKSSSTKRRRGGESVAAFLERWLADVVRPTRRERTLIGYRSIVTLHLVPAFGDKPLRALGRREVQAWVNRSPGSPTSVRHRVDCLRAAMSYAVRWGLIDANPASDLDLPSPVKRTVKALRPEDAKALLAAVEGTWFAPLVTVALYTGLRQGELLGLRWEDVNLGIRSDRAARVPRQARTGGSGSEDGDGGLRAPTGPVARDHGAGREAAVDAGPTLPVDDAAGGHRGASVTVHPRRRPPRPRCEAQGARGMSERTPEQVAHRWQRRYAGRRYVLGTPVHYPPMGTSVDSIVAFDVALGRLWHAIRADLLRVTRFVARATSGR